MGSDESFQTDNLFTYRPKTKFTPPPPPPPPPPQKKPGKNLVITGLADTNLGEHSGPKITHTKDCSFFLFFSSPLQAWLAGTFVEEECRKLLLGVLEIIIITLI